MIKRIKNTDINYVDYGTGKNTIVLLHGWGQNIEMMKPIGDRLSKNNRIIIVDLPGFGESKEPDTIWTMYDYTECIHELLESLKVKNPMLIGHSFGGKISLIYASKYDVSKLVLFGSPFKKEIKKLSLKRVGRSFKFSFDGLKYAYLHEQSLALHVIVMAIVIACGLGRTLFV